MGVKRVRNAANPYYSNLIALVGMTVGAEDTNVITVAVQLKGPGGENLASRGFVNWYLSNDANGDSIATTAPSGGVAAGTDGVVVNTTSGKAGWAVSESDGDIDFAITESGALTVYLVLVLPDGSLVVSDAITFTA